MKRFVITKQHGRVEFDSGLFDVEAKERLQAIATTDFAKSLAGAKHPTGKQWDWIHYIVWDHQQKAITAQAVAEAQAAGRCPHCGDDYVGHCLNKDCKANVVEHLNLIKVVAMLHFAQRVGGIKWPCIRIALEGKPGVKLTIAGPQARFPGSINICDISREHWYGRIHKNGKVQPRDIPDDVLEVLKALEADPAGTATLHGRRTGNCCFCGRELTAKDSLVCGYGPICADKFGLPHAGEAERRGDDNEGFLGLVKELVS